MFFKKLFLASILTICLNGFAFGQEVCGWTRVTKENAPQILKDVFPSECFTDNGSVEVSTDHSPWGKNNQHSLKFSDHGPEGYKFFMKYYGINVGDTFKILVDYKGFPKNLATHIRFYIISEGELYESDAERLYSTWTESENFENFEGWFTGKIAAKIDTLLFLVRWYQGSGKPEFPFGTYLDNLAYKKVGEAKTLFDKMGDEQGIEESELRVKSLELRVFPNPSLGNALIKYGVPQKATMTLRLYDISGRLVKTIYSGTQEKGYYEVDIKQDEMKGGIYFIRFETSEFKATRKLTISR